LLPGFNMNFKSSLVRNFTSLTTVNFINLALPLLTIPYLIKTIGSTNYGVLAFHQYLGQFALVVLEFGFPLYGVSEVARRHDDRKALGRFMADVGVIKLMVLVVVLLALLGAIAARGIFHWNSISPGMLSAFVVAAALNSFAPTWFFQGLDLSQRTVLPTFVARCITLGSTFLLVRSAADIQLASVPYLLGACAMFVLVSWQARSYLEFDGISSRKVLDSMLGESLHVFWSRVTILGYVTVSPILINFAAGPQGVAVYNLCEKAISVARMPFDMFAGASFARFSRSYSVAHVRKCILPLGLGGLCIVGIVYAMSPFVTLILRLPDLALLTHYLPIYALALIPISMHGFIGTCVLLSNGKRKELTLSIVSGLLSYATCLLILWPFVANKILLAIVGMVLVEFGIFFSRIFFAFKYRLI
jgi:PST family polysaccharide transporter